MSIVSNPNELGSWMSLSSPSKKYPNSRSGTSPSSINDTNSWKSSPKKLKSLKSFQLENISNNINLTLLNVVIS